MRIRLRQSTVFTRMRQQVTLGPLRTEGQIVGVVVTVEDVTARVRHERRIAGHSAGRLGDGGSGQLASHRRFGVAAD